MVVEKAPPMTRLLNGYFAGDREQAEEFVAVLYAELHRLAGAALVGKAGPAATLEPTGLVHEAWLRLSDCGGRFEHRRQFFAFAARVMRSVLIDHARVRYSLKRGGANQRVALSDSFQGPGKGELDFLELSEALERLRVQDEDLHDLVELRFFSGLSHGEIAELLGVSLSTVNRRWRLARAWLRGEINDEA